MVSFQLSSQDRMSILAASSKGHFEGGHQKKIDILVVRQIYGLSISPAVFQMAHSNRLTILYPEVVKFYRADKDYLALSAVHILHLVSL